MKCKQVQKRLIPYLDGERGDYTNLLRHLKTCPSCRREMANLQHSLDEFILLAKSQEPHSKPSSNLLIELNRRIEQMERSSLGATLQHKLGELLLGEQWMLVRLSAALVLVCVALGQYIQLGTIAYRDISSALLTETRIELHIGDWLRITLVRFLG